MIDELSNDALKHLQYLRVARIEAGDYGGAVRITDDIDSFRKFGAKYNLLFETREEAEKRGQK